MADHSPIVLAVPVHSDLANLAFALRREVFILEQGVPANEEFDEKDLQATHCVALVDGDVVATLRVIWHTELAQISRFVVRKSYRSAGVGSMVMKAAMKIAIDSGVARVFLEAQVDKVEFYRRFGFIPTGDQFMDGGMPHVRMQNYDANA